MENKSEDEVRKRWEQEAKDKAYGDAEAQQGPRKRVRAIEYQAATSSILGGNAFLGEALGAATGTSKTAAKGRRVPAKTPGRAAAAKARSKVTEIVDDEDEDVIEVD
jgi:hypothetical protein